MVAIDRVKTGLLGYDRLLKGGYLPSSVNLISGVSGAGKTLFALSFIYQGTKKYDEPGLFISLEESFEWLKQNSKPIGIDMSHPGSKISVYDVGALRKTLYSTRQEMESKDKSPFRFGNLYRFIRLNYPDIKRLAIDSVVPISIVYESKKEYRSSLFRFARKLRDAGITSVLTTELEKDGDGLSRFGTEDVISDSVTILRSKDHKGSIRIHKMRGSDHFKGNARYRISSKGISITK